MLEKNYNPADESEIFENWLNKGYFRAKPNPDKKPYTIIMPPPNVTGMAHMGHAFNNTIQDVLIRFKRMQGFEALWQPGTDHAAIATEVRVIEALAKEGLSKESLGREAFLEKVRQWCDKYGGTIINQLKHMGFSADWDRLRFTMDEGPSNAVLEIFVRLYNEGLIYRGERLVNWCTNCQTTISDAEVLHKETDSTFYHFKYPIVGTEEFLAFATTRPETMLGDTAIAVNPEDERYRKYVGKTVKVPFVEREIPIIADEYVEAEFGTGVVKITPGHDPNDFEVGERHNLPIINIMHDDGTLNENAATYADMDRFAARKRIIQEMDELDLFIKKEQLTNNVGTHDRCGEVIEPLIKLQWFVSMKELAKPAMDAYTSGELHFNRERYGKIYMHWLENIRDWCVSRQLWWGHRVPAYYCQTCGHTMVTKAAPAVCDKCAGTDLRQDEDTLDTWFSSGFWPFSTLGWPEQTEDLKYFYPTDVLVTADEIIFFWVVRMVFSGLKFMGELPFRDVIIHGKVLDEHGRKMSKSLDNGIDPIDVVEKYGADALRLTLVSGSAVDSDVRFSWERLDPNRNFLNKVWNASRFLLMQFDGESGSGTSLEAGLNNLRTEDQWILSRMNDLVKEVTEKLDEHELGLVAQKIVDFFWDEFCDWYVEMVKPRLYDKEDKSRAGALWTLKHVLNTSLKLLHPFTPFITETIFLKLQEMDGLPSTEETIMLSAWPVYDDALHFPVAVKEIQQIQEAVRAVRNIRTEMQVAPSKKVKIIAVCEDKEAADCFERSRVFFAFLAGAEAVEVRGDAAGIPETAVSTVTSGGVLYLPLDTLIDFEKERARLDKERKKLEQELARVEGKLSNQGFVGKAPPELIAAEEEKREKFRTMLAKVEEQAKSLLEI
ncbi:MAG: valine--tRNA ligase [Defluviitaleaceae bacterium]|nr:valine--tRNA ligase [Defluviitaleaceae bacterium]